MPPTKKKPQPPPPDPRPTTTTMQRIVGLEEVPAKKWQAVFVRTIIGLLFVLAGVAMVAVALHAYYHERELSVTLMGAGVASLLVGSTTWSTQFVVGAMMALLTPFKAYRRAFHVERSTEENGGES